MGKVAVSFTGGKDSVLALHLIAYHLELATQPQEAALQALTAAAAASSGSTAAAAAAKTAISLLVTFAPQGYDKPGQGFKAHPIAVIRAQARALGIPHVVCEVDPSISALDGYRQQMQVLHCKHGITQLVTGDILDVADGFMQKAVEATGVTLVMPLWQQPREMVLAACFALGIDSIISCINVSKFGAAAEAADAWNAVSLLLGKRVTPELLAGPLAEAQQLFGADLGGEHGEYHTLVFNAPLFLHPVELSVLEVVQSGDYAYVTWGVGGMTTCS